MNPMIQICRLEEVIASGVLIADSAGDVVTYRNLDEIERSIAYFKRKLADEQGDQMEVGAPHPPAASEERLS